MQTPDYPHRRVWTDWLRERTSAPIDPFDGLRLALDTPAGRRRVVVDTVDQDGYSGLLIAAYDGPLLTSLTLDDDEADALLWPRADA